MELIQSVQRDLNDNGTEEQWEDDIYAILIASPDRGFGGSGGFEFGDDINDDFSDDFYGGGAPTFPDTPILDNKDTDGNDKTLQQILDSISLIDNVFDKDTAQAYNPNNSDGGFTIDEIVILLKTLDLNSNGVISDDELKTIIELKNILKPKNSAEEKDILTSFKDYASYIKSSTGGARTLKQIKESYLNLIDLDGNGLSATSISANEKQIAREVFNFYQGKNTLLEVALLNKANQHQPTRDFLKSALVDNDASSVASLKKKFKDAKIN